MRGVVELAALIALGIALGRLVWLFVAPQGYVASITPPPTIANSSPAPTVTTPIDKSILLRVNAFMPSETAPAASTIDDVPETSLNLKLKGQRAVTGDGLGTAMIVTPDNRQAVYSEGQEILDGVFLSRVLSDRVILEKNGEFESLFREGRDGALNVLGDADEVRQTVENQEVVEGSVYRIASVASLLSSARLERVTAPPGWQFRSVGDPSVLRQAGLFDGDQLVSINGSQVADLPYESLAGLLSESNRVNIRVRRGTQTLNLTLVFEERIQ